jgi:hypothetical protein
VIATGIGANAQVAASMVGTQAESLSALPKTAAPTASAAPATPPPLPERIMEGRPAAMPVPPPARAAAPAPAGKQELDQIIPSASIAEVDAAIDALAVDAETAAAEESLPRPVAAAPAGKTIASIPAAAIPPPRMEQVEMFEEMRAPERAPRDEAVASRKDPRSESLARAQQIARSLGVTNLTDDEYDIPTFIRRQQQNPPVN